jgi:anti-sigma factor RsiW
MKENNVMNCNEIRELMPDLAAGLSVTTAEVNSHLQRCDSCAGKLVEFQQTLALLDEWKAPEPSPFFDTRLQARLREERAKEPQGWLLWVRKPALAVALAVMMMMSITLFRTDSGIHIRTRPKQVGDNWQSQVMAEPGTAVGDLQALDKNNELYSDFEVLDDLQVQQDVNANP